MKYLQRLVPAVVFALAACSSPVDSGHQSTVTATFNDTSWTASAIGYLSLTPVFANADSIEFAARGNGDTVEIHGFVEYNTSSVIMPPVDYIRLRRARGTYAVASINDGMRDTIRCTRLSFGVVEGTAWTSVELKNVANPNDSVSVRCSFSLANPSIP